MWHFLDAGIGYFRIGNKMKNAGEKNAFGEGAEDYTILEGHWEMVQCHLELNDLF